MSSAIARGELSTDQQWQLATLRASRRFLSIDRPAWLDDGIVALQEDRSSAFEQLGRRAVAAGRVSRFVPASGAATRMFSDVRERAGELWEGRSALALFEPQDEDPMPRAAESFAHRVATRYGSSPKALVPFHRYTDGVRTPLEEHIRESARFLAGGTARLHFTVAAGWVERFEETAMKLVPRIESAHGCRIHVSFSAQDPATDTIAVDDQTGEPLMRGEDLVLRPSGHGALLENLQRCFGDVVLLRNIDNVGVERDSQLVGRWHHILIGMLTSLQTEAHALIRRLNGDDGAAIEEARKFVENVLRLTPPLAVDPRSWLLERLDRPWRVGAMVRNAGEPGGGPFWVRSDRGTSLQIVESAQIDPSDAGQTLAVRASTHFNPVHLVCGMRRWTGESFDLYAFANPEDCIVTKKVYQGRNVRVLERPGLWNGAMAGWNTVFVEAPAETFAPVKTVFDLLRRPHVNAPTGTITPSVHTPTLPTDGYPRRRSLSDN